MKFKLDVERDLEQSLFWVLGGKRQLNVSPAFSNHASVLIIKSKEPWLNISGVIKASKKLRTLPAAVRALKHLCAS